MKYREYLQSAAWQKKRRQALYWHSKKCVLCGKEKVDIHHRTYKDLGVENAKIHLVPLCRWHHEQLHLFAEARNLNIWEASDQYIKRIRKQIGYKKPTTWKKMTPLERETAVGKIIPINKLKGWKI